MLYDALLAGHESGVAYENKVGCGQWLAHPGRLEAASGAREGARVRMAVPDSCTTSGA
jgi:hypothetical protein